MNKEYREKEENLSCLHAKKNTKMPFKLLPRKRNQLRAKRQLGDPNPDHPVLKFQVKKFQAGQMRCLLRGRQLEGSTKTKHFFKSTK